MVPLGMVPRDQCEPGYDRYSGTLPY